MQNPHIEMKYKMINNARSVSDGYKWNGDSSRLKLSHTGLTSPSERHPLWSALFWCWCHIEFDFRSITDSAMCGSVASFCVTWLCTNLPEMLCQMSASWFCTKKKCVYLFLRGFFNAALFPESMESWTRYLFHLSRANMPSEVLHAWWFALFFQISASWVNNILNNSKSNIYKNVERRIT